MSDRIKNRYLSRLRSHFANKRDEVFCRLINANGQYDLTWAELEADCARFCGAYQAAGLRPSDQILIFLEHLPELYGSFFGAMLGGFTPSFMPTLSPRQDPKIYWSSHNELLAKIAPAAIVAKAATFKVCVQAVTEVLII